jgi:putative ABC transport system permease protein
MLGTTARVTDVASTRQTVGSSLTAVDLAGLTRVELAFALIMAIAAGGLVFGLGLAERRRTFAIVTALGATGRQLRGMISSEALVLAVMGLVTGAACGSVLSVMLVKVLSGVFDPPPAALAIPWVYLGTVTAATILALAAVTVGAVRAVRQPAIGVLGEL